MQNLNIFYVIHIHLNYKLLANLKGQKTIQFQNRILDYRQKIKKNIFYLHTKRKNRNFDKTFIYSPHLMNEKKCSINITSASQIIFFLLSLNISTQS